MKTIDARRILPRFRTQITVRRKAVGTYTKGVYTPSGAETTFTIANASAQPLEADELELLPEGFSSKEAIKVYSPEMLRTADQATGVEADRIDYAGKSYEVHKVENWNDHGTYYKAIAVRM